MKFVIDQSALKSAVASIVKLTQTSTTIPILHCIRIVATEDHLTLTATDMDIWQSSKVEGVAIDRSGEIAIHGADLHGLIAASPAGSQIQLDAADNIAVIKVGRARYRLPLLDPKEFPAMPDLKDRPDFILSATVLAGLLKAVRPAAFADEGRPYLAGLHFIPSSHGKQRVLRVAATDSARLVRMTPEAPDGLDDAFGGVPKGILVSLETAAAIERLLDDGVAGIRVNERLIEVTTGDTVLISKLMDYEYPDIDRVVPDKVELSVNVSASALQAAVRRVTVFADRVDSKHKRGKAIFLQIVDGAIRVGGENTSSGGAVDQVDAETGTLGAPIDLGVNSTYLSDILEIGSGGTATIGVVGRDNQQPLKITFPDQPDVVGVLMQIRTARPQVMTEAAE